MSVYDRLRSNYPDLAAHITGSEARGNASHDNRPFSAAAKVEWKSDAREELADCLVYLEAQIEKENDDKRFSSDAYTDWLELRAVRRSIANNLARLDRIDRPTPGLARFVSGEPT